MCILPSRFCDSTCAITYALLQVDVPSNITSTATSSVNTTDVPQTAAPGSDDDIINNNNSIGSKEVPTNSTTDGSSGDTALEQSTTKINITGTRNYVRKCT